MVPLLWVHDELGVGLEVLEKSNEAPDVVLVEGCIHLIQHAKRARLHQVDSEQQRQRRESALATRQEIDPLQVRRFSAL